jgi:hypothetical protein
LDSYQLRMKQKPLRESMAASFVVAEARGH